MTDNARVVSRVLVLDPDERVLLLHYRIRAGLEVWIPPGGGVEADESLAECAARELREETEIDLAWDGLEHAWVHETDYSGRAIHETYLLVRLDYVPGVTLHANPDGPIELLEYRWWHCEEIALDESEVEFTPLDLDVRLRRILDGD